MILSMDVRRWPMDPLIRLGFCWGLADHASGFDRGAIGLAH